MKLRTWTIFGLFATAAAALAVLKFKNDVENARAEVIALMEYLRGAR